VNGVRKVEVSKGERAEDYPSALELCRFRVSPSFGLYGNCKIEELWERMLIETAIASAMVLFQVSIRYRINWCLRPY